MRLRHPNADFLTVAHAWTAEGAQHRLDRGMISARTYGRWHRLWTWGAPRLTGTAAQLQAAYAKRHGAAALHRRIGRAAALFARLRTVGPMIVCRHEDGTTSLIPFEQVTKGKW